jgi:hypothetical protein
MSAKSVAEKLQIKAAATVWSSHPEHLELIEPLPEGARVVTRPEEASAALLFGEDAASLRDVVAAHADRVKEADVLWVAYPKGNRSDINRDSVWPIVAEYGLRPITQVSVSDVWSALRFRPLKPGEEQFTGGRS